MRTIARSPKAAIKAKCVDCVYDPAAAGSKLVQTTLCACTDCPLWPFRPTTKARIPEHVLHYYNIRLGAPETARVVHFLSETSRTDTTPAPTQGQAKLARRRAL